MSISVSNSLSLRIFYNTYASVAKGATRKSTSTGTLSFADSTAMRNAIRKLQDYNFKESSDEQAQEKLKAFTDTVNNTLESASKYSSKNTIVRNAVNTIKDLNTKYADELKKIGITANKDGTLSVYESAAKNYSKEKFDNFFTKDSEYLNSLYTAAKKITRRVDVRI
jgi:hypothetical protein